MFQQPIGQTLPLNQQPQNSLLAQGSQGMNQQPIRPVPPLHLANQMQNMNLGPMPSPITPTGPLIKPGQGYQNTPPMQAPYVNGAHSQPAGFSAQYGPPRTPLMTMPGQMPRPGMPGQGSFVPARPTQPQLGQSPQQNFAPGPLGPPGNMQARFPQSNQSPNVGSGGTPTLPPSGVTGISPQLQQPPFRPPMGQPGQQSVLSPVQPPFGQPASGPALYPPGIRPMAPHPAENPLNMSPAVPPTFQAGSMRATPPPMAGQGFQATSQNFPPRYPVQAQQQGYPKPGVQQQGQFPPPGQQQPGQFPAPGMQQPGQYPQPGMQQPGQYPQPGLQQLGQYPQPGAYPPGSQIQQGASGGYPAPGGYPGAPVGYQQQQQQQRRLDPDQMPNPMQVWEDDKLKYGGQGFDTSQKGVVPPLTVTAYVTLDRGNCGPRFVRSTMYSIPSTPDLIKQTQIPLGLVISPMAKLAKDERPPAVMDFGHIGPPRCNRCKAYMCPYMQFLDGGRRFNCPFCKASTEVPSEYFNHLDHNGLRVDKYERPELWQGSYEFVVSKEYCRDNILPNAPAFVFLIDVSYNNVKNGLVQLLCENVKYLLESLPREGDQPSQMRVGFITYSNEINFWNLANDKPSMMVVTDVNDTFMPLVDGFLVDVERASAVIDSLLEEIPKIFEDTRETESILGPAIQGGLEALKAANTAGKLLVFHSVLPTTQAPGSLKPRDDRKLLGSEKEKIVLAPQSTYYNELGQGCSGAGVSVDLFLTNPTFIDVATLCQVSRLSGGTVYKYTYFQAGVDGHRILEDCRRSISNTLAFDSVMRVRTSTGIRPVDFYGSFFMSNTQDVEIAAVDTSKAVTVEIKHDDKITDEEAFFQVAFLYTSVTGRRRVRIHNLVLPTCSMISDIYKSVDLDAMMNLFSKQAVSKILEVTPKPLKDSLVARVSQVLATYRKHSASSSSPMGQLILPELLKLLPLYANCLIKSDALSGGQDLLVDDRALFMHVTQTMDVATSLNYLYPRLMAIHELPPEDQTNPGDFPIPIRCSFERLKQDGAYLLENGFYVFVWIGMSVNPVWLKDVFGVSSFNEVKFDQLHEFPELQNQTSEWVRGVMSQISEERPRCMKVTFVRPQDRFEAVMRRFLVEDKHELTGGSSYVDFLCHVHKEIRSILS